MHFSVPVEIGFCDSTGRGFLPRQPDEQIERWTMPVDNGSHLLIDWWPDRRVCGLNVTEYFVGFSSTLPLLDAAASIFGVFPQDVCAVNSKARRSLAIDGEADLDTACSPYDDCRSQRRRTSVVPIPSALRALARFDVEVSIRAWGRTAPVGKPQALGTPVTFWCHRYRRAMPAAEVPSKRGGPHGPRWWRDGWRAKWQQRQQQQRPSASVRGKAPPPPSPPPATLGGGSASRDGMDARGDGALFYGVCAAVLAVLLAAQAPRTIRNAPRHRGLMPGVTTQWPSGRRPNDAAIEQ